MRRKHRYPRTYNGRPMGVLSNVPQWDDRHCELCGQEYFGPSDLKGICGDCCEHLGGGKYSAKGMQAEVKALLSEGRKCR